MSSLAQEEIRSISENVTWGQRKRFANGKVNLRYNQFLGYRKGADGFPEVVPEEAIVVHRIYTRFMEGLTPGAHCKGTDSRWDSDSIEKTTLADQYSGKSIFSSRIVCGDCVSYFGSKVWNSTSKYRRVIWQCNSKFKGEHKCETPHLDEETIKAGFVAALNAIIDSKDSILEDCRLM